MQVPVRHALLLAATLAVAPPAGAQTSSPAAARSEVPIREVVQSDGMRRYAVAITVGGTAIVAGLDTGSPGLRILPGVLKPDDVQAQGGSTTISYGAGARLDGPVARARVRIGEASGEAPVQLVARVGCAPDKPNCAAGRIPLKDYGVQGDGLPGEGFKAILGLNTADNDVPAPLKAMGVRRWIVELPRPGENAVGRLVLNPDDAEVADYVRRPMLALGGGLHDAVEGCLQRLPRDAAPAKSWCGAVSFDTGAPGIIVQTDRRDAPLPPGTAGALVVTRDGKPVAAAGFQSEQRSQGSHLSFREPLPKLPGVTAIRAGTLPYFAWSVLYDPSAGVVGVKPRPQAPGGPTPMPGA